MEFNYYYGTEAEQFSFIRIPKILLTDSSFSTLSLPSKVLYGLLLDRMSLSVKNHWLDDKNRVFIIYQIADIQEDMGYSKKKAMEFLMELESIGLVEKKKRGFGLPSILYVKNFITAEMGTSRGAENDTSGDDSDDENESSITPNFCNLIDNFDKTGQKSTEIAPENGKIIDVDFRSVETGTTRGVDLGTSRSAEMGTSRGVDLGTSRGDESGTSEVSNREPLNSNTKYNNNNLSNIESHLVSSSEDEIKIWREYQEVIKENLELGLMYERYPHDHSMIDSICELVVETLISKNDTIVISGDRYPANLVKAKLLKLNSMHLEYVLDCLASNTTKVRNIKKYLLAALFNAPTTIEGYYQAKVNHDLPQYAKN